MGWPKSSQAGFAGALVLAIGLGAMPQPVLAQGASVDAAQIAFWQSVSNTKNPVELEAYLTAYPNGKFAPLAKIRLKALRAAGAKKGTTTEKSPVAPQPATVDKVAEYRFGEPGWLGASVATVSLTGQARQITGQTTAIRIDGLTSYGPAQKGGLLTRDIILAVGGRPQTRVDKFVEEIGALTPGAVAVFSVLRGNARVEISITIGGQFTDALVQARAGDASAQVIIGLAYAKGTVVEKDEVQARRWYSRAADQGNRHALNNLGNIYWYGRGVPKDEYQAIEWYRQAAEKGHAAAQTHVGYAYANGQGARQSDRLAVEWYQKAAAQNESYALNNLALLYEDGRGGLRKSRRKAIELFRRSASLGNQLAITNLKKRRVAAYDLAQIQRSLSQLGYEPGPADAKMGAKTRAAIRAFQTSAGLRVNGKASLDLAARLRDAIIRANRPAMANPVPATVEPVRENTQSPTEVMPNEEIRDLDALD